MRPPFSSNWLECSKEETALKKRVKDADMPRSMPTPTLTIPISRPTEIQDVGVVDDKWLAALGIAAIRGRDETVSVRS